jgi:hypothetical protein
MYRDSHVLTLHRYIPTPVFIPGLGKFVEIMPGPTYLARSSDGTSIKTLTTGDLNACLNIGHTYFCSEHFLQRPLASNCLLQLYTGLKEETLPYCNVHVLPEVSTIRQLSASTYLLAESQSTKITTSCFRQPSLSGVSKLEAGTYVVTTNPNCTTTSPSWVIHPTLQVEDVAVVSKVTQYDFNPATLQPMTDPIDLNALHKALSQIGQPVPLDQMTQLVKFRKDIQAETADYWLHHASMGTSSVLTVCVLIGLITLIYLGVKRSRARARARAQPDPAAEQHHIPLLNIVQAAPPPVAPAVAEPVASASTLFRFGPST